MKLLSAGVGLLLAYGSVACGGDEGQPSTGASSGGTANGDGGVGMNPNGFVGCKDGSECASGSCFVGGMQSFCTVKCTTADATTTCVTPLTGTCNKQGYCKRD